MSVSKETQKQIDFLLAFSGDIIASYTLAKHYDLKDVAYAIDHLFGQHGSLSYTESGDDGYSEYMDYMSQHEKPPHEQ